MADDGGAIGSRSSRDSGTARDHPPALLLLAGVLLGVLVTLIVVGSLASDDVAGVFDGDDEAETAVEDSTSVAQGADTGAAAAAPAATPTTAPAAERPSDDGCPSGDEVTTRLFGDIAGVVGCDVDVIVTVSGVLDDRAFAAKDLGGEVVVIDASTGHVMHAGHAVRVIGTVVEYHQDVLGSELDLDAGVYERFEGKALVLAESTTPG